VCFLFFSQSHSLTQKVTEKKKKGSGGFIEESFMPGAFHVFFVGLKKVIGARWVSISSRFCVLIAS